jgi:hypothetical protein
MLTCENYILKSFCRHKFKNASIIGDIYGGLVRWRGWTCSQLYCVTINACIAGISRSKWNLGVRWGGEDEEEEVEGILALVCDLWWFLALTSSSICIMRAQTSARCKVKNKELSYVRSGSKCFYFNCGPDSTSHLAWWYVCKWAPLVSLTHIAGDVFQLEHDDGWDGSYQGEKRQYDNENNVAHREP